MSKKNRGVTRKRVFFFITLLLPVLFLLLVEAGLRLLEYGGNTALFVSTPDEQSEFYGINLNIGSRYFSQIDFLPTPRKDLFLKEKPSNGYRIFVLGGSTAAGFPYGNNLTFPRILHRRLLDTFPDRHIEVINMAMSAINSYSFVDFTDEILAHKPDLLLIYAGHNEYYGALGVGSVESLGRSGWIIKTYLKMQRLKLFLLLRDSLRRIRSWMSSDVQVERNDPTATTMARIVKEQTIPVGSRLYHAGKEQFRNNLGEIFEKAMAAEIPVLISELISNVHDQEPFISVRSDSFPAAIAEFRKAQDLEKRTRYSQAHAAYYRAKDLDALRFRAPEDFNLIIHNLAAKSGVPVVPMISHFESSSPNRLIGDNLMLDHLHPNLDGYFLMADAFYKTMQAEELISSDWAASNMKPASFYRKNWGYTELDSLYGGLSILQLKGGWPFKQTPGPNLALERYQASTKKDSIVLEILKTGALTLETGHLRMAEFYEKRGDLERAFREYEALTYTVPHLDLFYQPAIKVLMAMQQYERATKLLQGSLRYHENVFSQKWLGQLYLIRGETRKGISVLEMARQSSPGDTQLLYNLGRAYFNISDRERGDAILSELKRLAPNSHDATRLKAFKLSLEAGSSDISSYLKKAQNHLKARQLDEALTVLYQSLQIRETAAAYELIGEILLVTKNQSEALEYLKRARRLKSTQDPKLLYNLSSAYFLNARYREAWDTFTELKKIYPAFPDPGNLEDKLRQALGH